jgi:hypothetical protein
MALICPFCSERFYGGNDNYITFYTMQLELHQIEHFTSVDKYYRWRNTLVEIPVQKNLVVRMFKIIWQLVKPKKASKKNEQ